MTTHFRAKTHGHIAHKYGPQIFRPKCKIWAMAKKRTSPRRQEACPFVYGASRALLTFWRNAGVSYYRARFYDSTTSRFLSEDPILSTIRTNRYNYARNSPANRIDSSGLTDRSSGSQNPDPGHCTLAYTLPVLRWTTSTRGYFSDWHFLTSNQEGPEVNPLGIPAIAITCTWQRTYVNDFWGHTLTAYYWNCWDTTFCGFRVGGANSKITFGATTDWQGSEFGGTETTTTSHQGAGAEDETNDVLCVTDPRSRPH